MSQTQTGELLIALLGLKPSQLTFPTNAEISQFVASYQERVLVHENHEMDFRVVGTYSAGQGLRLRHSPIVNVLTLDVPRRRRQEPRSVLAKTLGAQVIELAGRTIGLAADTMLLVRRAVVVDQAYKQQLYYVLPITFIIEHQAAQLVRELAA